MKTLLMFGTLMCLGTALCLADSYNGKLVDSNCTDRQRAQPQDSQKGPQSACTPTRSTTNFGVQTRDGQTMKLDSTGNAKAAEMMHSRTGGGSNSGGILVTITGTPEGSVLRVDTIELQQQ